MCRWRCPCRPPTARRSPIRRSWRPGGWRWRASASPIALHDLVEHRLSGGDARAEIALDDADKVIEVLLQQRLIEAEVMPHRLDSFLAAGPAKEHDLDGIARNERP